MGQNPWRRFKDWRVRTLPEVRRVQLEMERENPHPRFTPFPRSKSPVVIIGFWVLLAVVTIICWTLLRGGR